VILSDFAGLALAVTAGWRMISLYFFIAITLWDGQYDRSMPAGNALLPRLLLLACGCASSTLAAQALPRAAT
jgi:hypothetical protein